jgi:predicted tellurium resistance membrane protein TerC
VLASALSWLLSRHPAAAGWGVTPLGFGFGTTVVVVLLATVILVGGLRIAAAVLPRLVQALVALGSAILAVAVLASVIVLLQALYHAFAPH